jgi:hypothetical protein
MSELHHGGMPAAPVPAVLSYGRHAPDDPPPLAPSSSLGTVENETRHYRHDGWTPAARAAFLDMLAKSGVVTDACREVQRSSQAAYALRNRDRLFAAGWDAALSMARTRLADELFHRAVHGNVDQIWKDGEVVAERHRHDNRLSIAVLNRLDSRCDRDERNGAPTLRLVERWDAYVAALAEDRVADVEALLAPQPAELTPSVATFGQGNDAMLIHQLHQLHTGRALAEQAKDVDREGDEEERVWIEYHSWRTNFPPPDDFNGDEQGEYGEEDYNRQCTPEERTLLDRCYPDAVIDERNTSLEADEAQRDSFFAALAAEVASPPQDDTQSLVSKPGDNSP